MSISNDIRKLLDIQDENITFEENCVHIEQYKGKTCKFVKGRLTYEPTSCAKCSAIKEGASIFKNGTQTSRITIPIAGAYPTYLLLKKQRFMCQACGSSFTAKTPVVNDHCFIAKTSKVQVLIKSAEAQSIKNISKDCYLSHTTIQRVINAEAKQCKPYNQTLPKHVSFDEFKYAKGLMAFEYIDAETGDILDILEGRDRRTIQNHFITHYSLKDRMNVETVTIDMNAGYVSSIKELFPNVKIIIDRFHLVQLVNRSMNKTRVKIMNKFHTSNGEDMKKYRRLKAYWKLFLKKESDLSYTEYKHYPLFGQRLESAIVQEMLAYDEELAINYNLYQSLLRAMNQRDFKALENILNQRCPNETSTYLRTSLKTLRKHLPYTENSFNYPYNNGRIEGINNKIKVLNRVAYGYRNFKNYKNRIILHFNLKAIEQSVGKTIENETRPTAA
ncbi:transposase [Streptohalobacillus salinus]|uniref:Transposase n=1 Tax=Streptohalobacillus salinus TaxID=621096 RepID=A0A2V3VXN2_9BACI|nr:ISL3 family transposase [Streptohalobacillus salinus]PXW85448.1 transposase [Streptohalobacillus salinus]